MSSVPPHMVNVTVALDRSDVAYLLQHMLTDDMRMRASGNIGGATVVRKIVLDAIADHKRTNQALKMPTDVQPGWPDKKRLMARR